MDAPDSVEGVQTRSISEFEMTLACRLPGTVIAADTGCGRTVIVVVAV
jgi:hypothetical protein